MVAALSPSDVWLAAALGAMRGRIGLRHLLGAADALDHAIPTFDEIRYGIPRLIDAGLAEYLDGQFAPTPRAIDLYRQSKGPNGTLDRFANMLDVPSGRLTAEDRTLGPLEGLSEEDYQNAYRSYLNLDGKSAPDVGARLFSKFARFISRR